MYCDIAVMGRKGTACSDYRFLLVNVSALHIVLYTYCIEAQCQSFYSICAKLAGAVLGF